MIQFIRKRPWIIIVLAQALFIAWWVAFVCFAVQHQPQTVETPGRARH